MIGNPITGSPGQLPPPPRVQASLAFLQESSRLRMFLGIIITFPFVVQIYFLPCVTRKGMKKPFVGRAVVGEAPSKALSTVSRVLFFSVCVGVALRYWGKRGT